MIAGSEQVTGTLSGFLRVALLRHLSLAADAEREQIIARYVAARTRTAARDFILTVKEVLRPFTPPLTPPRGSI